MRLLEEEQTTENLDQKRQTSSGRTDLEEVPSESQAAKSKVLDADG